MSPFLLIHWHSAATGRFFQSHVEPKEETLKTEPEPKSQTGPAGGEIIWGSLLHLSYNMWLDRPEPAARTPHLIARPYLRFHVKLWNELLRRMAEIGMNMVVIDLGDAIRYASHPEIAVRNAWTPAKLRRELAKVRELGLEPIPKLNFSTGHDAWLGPYSRCVSTDTYYAVCRDLIEEVIDLFDTPRFFHLGMDEENAYHQRHYAYVVIRQHELWWHDLRFLAEQVQRHNVRPWIWSDYYWHHPELFLKNMPRSVLQSNWYYDRSFSLKRRAVKAYLDLEAHGYDQIPTGSNWSWFESFPKTAQFCRRHIAPKRLLGFLQTPWTPTLQDSRDHHLEAISAVEQAIRKWK